MQIKVRLDSRLAKRWAERLSKERINHAARVLAPTLLALTLTGVAHAQGTMDFSGAQTLMGTFKTTLLRSVREAAEDRGYVVKGFAPTSRAAIFLRLLVHLDPYSFLEDIASDLANGDENVQQTDEDTRRC